MIGMLMQKTEEDYSKKDATGLLVNFSAITEPKRDADRDRASGQRETLLN